MSEEIVLVRGDDSNFLNETLLFIDFKSEDIDLNGFKAFLTIENSHNYTKKYDIIDGSIEIILHKAISATLEVGIHRCNIKLIDTLGRVRTVKNFNIRIIDEFDVNDIKYSEHVIDVGFSSKDYNMLFNKPSINNVELSGNKTLEELGIQHAGNYSTIEYVDTLAENINSEIDSLELKVNKKSDIDYVNDELALKADKTDLNTKANISDIPTRVSQLVNDEGYLTEHQDISNKADIDYVEELLERKSDKNDTYTKVEVNTLIDDVNDNIELKQDKLTAGDNILIDENNVISAIGSTSGSVTSINGKTGDVELTAEDVGALPDTTVIPDISNLATQDELVQGLDTKQDKGDYALISDIPDLTDYVKNTDYASFNKAGLIRTTPTYGLNTSESTGVMYSVSIPLGQYETVSTAHFISKGTLENIKDNYVKRGVTENALELTEDEKASAKQWLGFATPTEIMQAIASIPQFKLSIVDELPTTGEKMTLYLVSKGGESPDVYDEYIWIEQTTSFEFLGTTAVDLTDYVKNTDYASSAKAGIIKTTGEHGLWTSAGILKIQKATDEQIIDKKNEFRPIVPANLDLTVKTGVTTNTIELTDEEKTSARTWLGAVGSTDYAGDNAGVIKRSNAYGTTLYSGYLIAGESSLEQYKTRQNSYFIGKGTLDNVLTQYAKTVLTTEADYEALETKDSNTLYLIEE